MTPRASKPPCAEGSRSIRANRPLALLAGTYAGSKGHPDTGRWLSVVMEEAPGWGAPHAVAARWLFARGQTDQALLEIREAEQRHAGSGHEVLCEVLKRFPRMEYIERAAPDEDRRTTYLNRTARCPGLPVILRAEIDSAILQAEPTHASAVLREAQRLALPAARSRRGRSLSFERALQHNADNDKLRVTLIRAHLEAGDPERASGWCSSKRWPVAPRLDRCSRPRPVSKPRSAPRRRDA